jgi:hypothetical protein
MSVGYDQGVNVLWPYVYGKLRFMCKLDAIVEQQARAVRFEKDSGPAHLSGGPENL